MRHWLSSGASTMILLLSIVLVVACGSGPVATLPVSTDTANQPDTVLPSPTPSSIPPSPTVTPALAPTATGHSAGTVCPVPASSRWSDIGDRHREPRLGDTWLRPADGMQMVYVPAGTFPMGSGADDAQALSEEQPQRTVSLDGFWIDQTEVTNDQFLQFLNERGNIGVQGAPMIVLDQGYTQISPRGDQFVAKEVALDRPVVMVTWHGAADYCAWAGGRLPTEAEWEYAARGPDGNLYPWGDEPPTCDLANHGPCVGVPQQVGSRPAGASWCGALDMAGNVWEWVNDWFGPYADGPQQNPTGPASGDVPVLRGGGWHSPPWELRAAYRQHELPATGFNG